MSFPVKLLPSCLPPDSGGIFIHCSSDEIILATWLAESEIRLKLNDWQVVRLAEQLHSPDDSSVAYPFCQILEGDGEAGQPVFPVLPSGSGGVFVHRSGAEIILSTWSAESDIRLILSEAQAVGLADQLHGHEDSSVTYAFCPSIAGSGGFEMSEVAQ